MKHIYIGRVRVYVCRHARDLDLASFMPLGEGANIEGGRKREKMLCELKDAIV